MVTVQKRRLPILFSVLVLVLAVIIVGAITYMLRQGGGSLPVTGQAPNTVATNIDGRQVSMSQLSGKVRLVTWFYTHCPDECPLTASQMHNIQEKLKQQGKFGKDVVFVSISVDPKGDTPAAMLEFAKEHGADLSGWYFLRTAPEQAIPMLKAWGIQVKQGDGIDQLDHVLQTDLIDSNGNIRKTYGTALLPENEVLTDINGLLSRQSW